MELSAIYHRPESEYAYFYKDKKLHIRIRTKKGDIESINLHYGDPFIFMEEFYQDTKEMVKITSGTLFDHWQVEVSVDFARIQYLFELRDTEGQNILYGDKGCVENSLENLHAIGNGFKLPYLHEIDACKVPDWVSDTVWYQIFPERFANGNALLNPEGTLDWDSSVTPKSDDFFGGDSHVNNRQEYDNTGSGNLQPEKWNETAKQLYNVIMWLIILWNAKPDTPLFNFKDEVIKYKTYEPFESSIKRVNTTIKNGSKGKTLTEMINGYRADNDIRDEICNFNILKNKIRDMKDQQGNTMESYF